MIFDFSERTNWNMEENLFVSLYHQLKLQNKLAVDLMESNPTRCCFSSLSPEIIEPLGSKKNITYTPDSCGSVTARRAVCHYYAQRGYDISEDQIILTASTSEAYTYLFRLLLNPYDTALLPYPSYPLFNFLADINDVKPRYYPLVLSGNDWAIDCASDSFLDMKDVKTVILVNPNNPTGSYVTASERKFVNALCVQSSAAIICDEVFWDYHFTQTPSESFVNNEECLTFVLSGFSKVIGLPQLKLSWIVINGPQKEVAEARHRLEMIADTYLSVNSPVQNIAGHCLSFSNNIQKDIKLRLNKNLAYLQNVFNGSLTQVIKPQGGWYTVLKVSDNLQADRVAERLLKEYSVYIHPGYFFDFDENEYLILSLLPEIHKFQEGIEKLKAVLEAVSV